MIEDEDIRRAVEAARRGTAEYLTRFDYAVQYRDETAIEHLIRAAVARVLGVVGEVGFDVVRSIWNWLVTR
ncbi:hypothetical protein [Sphaerisporangium sp. TRM90804]|uniref:hypothetical protein n=1 Tax=Sphaerisporangium sp. TRM90804 TaxID=3031113 RepID=UPI0024479124|nr:hypothetical protein [Sphaerisporangium sp. TRM90804]MDH2426296.1 hypothetical protein [Sphaerisporangium sp. TRM90804]